MYLMVERSTGFSGEQCRLAFLGAMGMDEISSKVRQAFFRVRSVTQTAAATNGPARNRARMEQHPFSRRANQGRNAGVCFSCGQSGHRRSECPRRDVPQPPPPPRR